MSFFDDSQAEDEDGGVLFPLPHDGQKNQFN